ncbi:hypothetical protein TM239_10750 [Bradyrhizobium sp. TM239]|nr:hypothetical protein TM239_10750 [Bradyrhizobium sp. TM239]
MGEDGRTIGDHGIGLGGRDSGADELYSRPMRSTTPREKAKIVAGAVTAVIMTVVLFVFMLGFLLAP